MITETVVELVPGEEPRVKSREIPADTPLQTEQALVSSHEIWCDGFALVMWDQPNFQGNRLCFFGQGEVYLSSYCRLNCGGGGFQGNWSRAVKSFKTQNESGAFTHAEAGSYGFCQDEEKPTVHPLVSDARCVSLY